MVYRLAQPEALHLQSIPTSTGVPLDYFVKRTLHVIVNSKRCAQRLFQILESPLLLTVSRSFPGSPIARFSFLNRN